MKKTILTLFVVILVFLFMPWIPNNVAIGTTNNDELPNDIEKRFLEKLTVYTTSEQMISSRFKNNASWKENLPLLEYPFGGKYIDNTFVFTNVSSILDDIKFYFSGNNYYFTDYYGSNLKIKGIELRYDKKRKCYVGELDVRNEEDHYYASDKLSTPEILLPKNAVNYRLNDKSHPWMPYTYHKIQVAVSIFGKEMTAEFWVYVDCHGIVLNKNRVKDTASPMAEMEWRAWPKKITYSKKNVVKIIKEIHLSGDKFLGVYPMSAGDCICTLTYKNGSKRLVPVVITEEYFKKAFQKISIMETEQIRNNELSRIWLYAFIGTKYTVTAKGKKYKGVIRNKGWDIVKFKKNLKPSTVVKVLFENGNHRKKISGKVDRHGDLRIKKVVKKANMLKGKTVKIKYKKLKKKNMTIKRAKAISVTKAQGKVTYKLAKVQKAKFKKYFKVNKKNGNITVKKRLKKGKYRLKIRVMAAGNDQYNKIAKTATVSIKVK